MEKQFIKYQVEPMLIGDEEGVIEEMGFEPEKFKCFKCHNFLLDTFKTCRYTKTRGKVIVWICLICGARNTYRDLDFRMQHRKKIIEKFIELRECGWTPYKIVSHNKLKIGIMTSFRWEKKYILNTDGGKFFSSKS